METAHITDEPVRAYLLGQLADHEAVVLEEKYFVDPSFFRSVQTAERALIADYLDNRLSRSERRQFEDRYLRLPALKKRFEEVRAQWHPPLPSARPASRWAWRAAFAACLTAIVAAGVWLYLHRAHGAPKGAAQAQSHQASPSREAPGVVPAPPQQQSVPAGSAATAGGAQPSNLPAPSSAESERGHVPTPGAPAQEAQTKEAATGGTPKQLAQMRPPAVAPGVIAPPAFPRRDALAGLRPEDATSAEKPASTTEDSSMSSGTRKKRIAILDFDYSAVRADVIASQGNDQDIGKSLSLLFEQQLADTRKYRVMDRKTLNKALADRQLTHSELSDPDAAAAFGRILGVDAVFLGSVTRFAPTPKASAANHGVTTSGSTKSGDTSGAPLAATVRLIDSATGNVVEEVDAPGGGTQPPAAARETEDPTSTEAVRQALTKALDIAGKAVEGTLPHEVLAKDAVVGSVTSADGSALVISMFTDAGIKMADRLTVLRPSTGVPDPSTGVAKAIYTPLGTATVTVLLPDGHVQAVFEGTIQPKDGDVVKRGQ
jgi:curli biogenesis system outer membrane secretion channel CsgG